MQIFFWSYSRPIYFGQFEVKSFKTFEVCKLICDQLIPIRQFGLIKKKPRTGSQIHYSVIIQCIHHCTADLPICKATGFNGSNHQVTPLFIQLADLGSSQNGEKYHNQIKHLCKTLRPVCTKLV